MPRDRTVSTAKFEDIPRSATRRSAEHGTESRPLSAWSQLEAFVLLAEPGGGKSRAFEFEAKAAGAVYVKARTFANVGTPKGWDGETLFIDGLDEMRADSASRNGPLDAVIQRLKDAGSPPFRLSCREADWLAAVDHDVLREVAPGKQLDALYLNPLNDEEVIELLRRRADRVPDAAQFFHEAKERSLDGLLRNPLLLELLVDSVGSVWPRGRADVYRLACERMAAEHNPAISAARSSENRLLDQTLHDAGILCAVLLLAGLDGWDIGAATDSDADASVQTLPHLLVVGDVKGALSSKLFLAEGQRRLPRHRSVAEYLAARAIGRKVTQGRLPISRVLALMSGNDGGIVEPLRGLCAWLAVSCPLKRAILIERDPLACVLYGDVHAFGRDDKRRVLDGLRREAERFVWFRKGNWAAHPFGALGTADMTPEFAALLKSKDRSPAQQSLIDCALDAIRHGEQMPRLLPRLESVFRDSSYREDVRAAALDAWLAQSTANLQQARIWLDEMRDGLVVDPRDELCGRLLEALYPTVLGPVDVMRYFHVSRTGNFVGSYRLFWATHLIERTPAAARPLLVDTLAATELSKEGLRSHYELLQLLGRWIAAALDALGSSIDVVRVAKWLALGLDEYGFAALKGDEAGGIQMWLERHPDVQKALAAQGYAQVQPDPQTGRFHFWSAEEIRYQARRPRDWFRWMLAHAAAVDSGPLVEYCFVNAARAAFNKMPEFDLDLKEVEHWVDANRHRWPQAEQWLEQVGSLPLDHWLGTQYRQQLDYANERTAERAERRAALTPHLRDIEAGRASPHLMHELAMSFHGRFTNIHGETPEERVRDLLGGDAAEAARAIAGFEAVIGRSDLPTVEEILAADLERKPYYLLSACLLGAELADARDPHALHGWTDDLVRRLIAFRLTDGTGDVPRWYNLLAEHRPAIVAEVLGAYARQSVLQRAEHSITGFWALAREPSQAELARIVIPPLLRSFPKRARAAQLRRLNTELLPAAIRHLTREELKSIVEERLAIESLGSAQRTAWLVVGLRFAAHRRSRELAGLVGASRGRALRLGRTLGDQSEHAKTLHRLPAAAMARLIELLGPLSTSESPLEGGWVGTRDELREITRALINQLAALDEDAAAEEIERLRNVPALAGWRVSLDAALFDHKRAMRSARFSHASAESVANALSGEAPANALDLAALVLQQLEDLEAHLRGDDTNSLSRFWRDPTTKGRQPRTENQCRDLLLGKLRDSLGGQNVSLHKEAAHANDTRADLRAETMVAYQRRVVPIEIKKEDHRQLWTAWRDQLEYRYMTDPAAEGVGIYLILWFGNKPVADAGGLVPASADQLRERLTALISPEDRTRLRVFVLDLSHGARQRPVARGRTKTKRLYGT